MYDIILGYNTPDKVKEYTERSLVLTLKENEKKNGSNIYPGQVGSNCTVAFLEFIMEVIVRTKLFQIRLFLFKEN